MFLREFLYLAERTNFWIDRQGVGLTIYPAAPSGLFFFFFLFFSNRWAKMKEREGQREEKDEHPSPFAPYRNRWLGLISKNNMRTDEAPPPLAQNPKGGAKYCWGTLTFLIFFPKEWDEANKNKRKPYHFFVLVLFVSGFFFIPEINFSWLCRGKDNNCLIAFIISWWIILRLV